MYTRSKTTQNSIKTGLILIFAHHKLRTYHNVDLFESFFILVIQVLPYFKKSEAQNGRYSSDSKNHGQDGPLPVSDSVFVSPLAELYGKMAKAFGFLTRDINGDNQTGFDIPQVKITMIDKSDKCIVLREHWINVRFDTFRSVMF